MRKFERISQYENDNGVIIPTRKTAESAGYDFYAAEDTIVPSYHELIIDWEARLLEAIPKRFKTQQEYEDAMQPITMVDMAALSKEFKIKPTLVPTGIKCALNNKDYLQLSVRSSLPLKHWLVMANGVGIIDADYYNNPDNEGHIYFQLINLSPFNIIIHKGDCFGQGIILRYGTTDNENEISATREGGFGSTNGSET